MNRNNALVAVAFAILGAIAIVGWNRKAGSPEPAQAALAPISAYDSYGQRTAEPVNASFAEGTPVQDRYVGSIHRPVRIVSQPVSSRQYLDDRNQQAGRREFADREPVRIDRHDRSKEKSALIVGGSAAGGAAIGAVAGGGKGAALGALSGGAAGFIYDRLTHKHH